MEELVYNLCDNAIQGLAIVKHIVAVHNAKLYVESEVGKGTSIKVEFNK